MPHAPVSSPSADSDRRIVALDGLRGIACIMVLISHYFGEVAHGVQAATVGWIGVDIFFVLSGFLIGRLILDKRSCSNFFTVFYARRFWRIIPAYLVAVFGIALLLQVVPSGWKDAGTRFPLWTYLAFVQGFWMTATSTIGAHWLAPTWTLAVEEQFYLLAPALIVFLSRRALVAILLGVAIAAPVIRAAGMLAGDQGTMATLVLLPGRADLMVFGIAAALVLRSPTLSPLVTSGRLLALRCLPLLALVVACLTALRPPLFHVLGPTLLGIGGAAFMLCIVLGASEAQRLNSSVLQFFGNNAYCIYLTHLPVLGLMHGLFLGTVPDLASSAQWLVTCAAVPVCVLVGWIMTKLVEEPCMILGRRWRWARHEPQPASATRVAALAS